MVRCNGEGFRRVLNQVSVAQDAHCSKELFYTRVSYYGPTILPQGKLLRKQVGLSPNLARYTSVCCILKLADSACCTSGSGSQPPPSAPPEQVVPLVRLSLSELALAVDKILDICAKSKH
jgi:hypothetical protein